MEVFLHPQTGRVIATRGGSEDWRHNFIGWLAKFHNSFHLDKKGEWLLGVFSLFFLLSLITGIILYRKNILNVMLFRKNVYRRSNIHQVIGVYALLFNLMFATTGFWMQRYVFKKDFYRSFDYKPALKPSASLNYSVDSAFYELKKKDRDFTPYVVYFPQSKSGKTTVYGSHASNAFIHSRQYADAITFDSNGTVSNTRFINEINADDRYDIINSQLHMGNFGGMPIKIIYFIFGISGAVLSITGFRLWFKRKQKQRPLTS